MDDNYEKKLLNMQIIGTCIFIVSSFVSIILTYNDKKDLDNNAFIDKNSSNTINRGNRVVSFLLVCWFFYINYQFYDLGKKRKKNLKPLELQISSSTLLLIASIISLYIAFTDTSDIANIENPIV